MKGDFVISLAQQRRLSVRQMLYLFSYGVCASSTGSTKADGWAASW